MATRNPDSLDRLSQADLIGVVRELIGEVGRLRAENEKLGVALTQLKAEHQAVKDELARLKKLPPRPPQKPSGMDKATDRGGSGGGDKSAKGEKSRRRRGSQLDKLTIGATIVVRAQAPVGSRHGLRGDRGSGPEPEPAGDALSAGALGNAGGQDDHRQTRSRDCRGVWPQSASPSPGASFLRASHLRADRRASQWHGHYDFEAASRALAGGQARDLPRRGRSGVESRPRRRLCHGRRYRRAPRRQERLHHADRLRYLHGVSHRSEQVAPGVSVAVVRRRGAPCDQRRGARLYERPPITAGRHRQARGSQGAYFRAPRGLGAAFAGAGPDRPESRP